MNNNINEILQLIGNAYYYGNIDYEKKQKYCDYITNLQEIEKEHKNCTRKHWQSKCAKHCANEKLLQARIEKAIEYINKCRDYHKTYHNEDKMFPDELTSLIIILEGDDKE